jgi:hypothetical protein
MTTKLKFILIGLLCILTGSIWFYLQGYKGNGFINVLSYCITFIGWLIILFSFAGQILGSEKTVKFQTNRQKWFIQKTKRTSIIFLFCGLVVSNTILFDNLANSRVQNILDAQPTNTTIATVKELRKRPGRNGGRSVAIINYVVDNDVIEQDVSNYKNRYSVGQQYEIKYSIKYPEMFVIIAKLENK